MHGTNRKIMTWQWLYSRSPTVASHLSCKMMIHTSLVGLCSLRRETSNSTSNSLIKVIISSIQFLAIISALLYACVSIRATVLMTPSTYERIYSIRMDSVQSRTFKYLLSMHQCQCPLVQILHLFHQHDELFPTTLSNKTDAAHSSDHSEKLFPDHNLFIFQ